jgi:hypothetical protein
VVRILALNVVPLWQMKVGRRWLYACSRRLSADSPGNLMNAYCRNSRGITAISWARPWKTGDEAGGRLRTPADQATQHPFKLSTAFQNYGNVFSPLGAYASSRELVDHA